MLISAISERDVCDGSLKTWLVNSLCFEKLTVVHKIKVRRRQVAQNELHPMVCDRNILVCIHLFDALVRFSLSAFALVTYEQVNEIEQDERVSQERNKTSKFCPEHGLAM